MSMEYGPEIDIDEPESLIEPEDVSTGGIIRKVPTRPPSITSVQLNDTRAILPPDELARLDRELESIARQRQIPPPDIGVN